MLDKEGTPGGLVPVPAVRAGKFHTAHKLAREAVRRLLRAMAHGHWKAQWLGTTPRWAASSPTPEYGAMLMEGLGVMGTRGKHVNVLQHLMGYLKDHLSGDDKAYLR